MSEVRVGTAHPFYLALKPILEKLGFDVESNLGIGIDAWGLSNEYTREEEKGFHWLLQQWLIRDSRIANMDLEALKEWVCCNKWGTIIRVDPDGQELPLAARRTTRVWDHDRKRYKRKLASIEDYSELITKTYELASERGITLPELKKKDDRWI